MGKPDPMKVKGPSKGEILRGIAKIVGMAKRREFERFEPPMRCLGDMLHDYEPHDFARPLLEDVHVAHAETEAELEAMAKRTQEIAIHMNTMIAELSRIPLWPKEVQEIFENVRQGLLEYWADVLTLVYLHPRGNAVPPGLLAHPKTLEHIVNGPVYVQVEPDQEGADDDEQLEDLNLGAMLLDEVEEGFCSMCGTTCNTALMGLHICESCVENAAGMLG